MIVLKKVFSPVKYKHYCIWMLCEAIHHILYEDLDSARLFFFLECEGHYRNIFTVYNVHGLTHIPDDVELFWKSLDEISAFLFENYLIYLSIPS